MTRRRNRAPWIVAIAGLACGGVVAESTAVPSEPGRIATAAVRDGPQSRPPTPRLRSRPAEPRPAEPAAPRVRPAAETPSVAGPPTAASLEDTCPEPPRELDVLFIGNSYTDGYDLPGQVADLAERAGVELDVGRLVVHGEDFAHHLARPETAATIANEDWDVVVLQSHSLDTLRHPRAFMEAGTQLVRMVEEAGAEAVVFETWPRRAGHTLYETDPRTGGSPARMLETVREAYTELADRTGAEVAPVGDAWLQLLRTEPELELYARDGHHPGRLGAYLTANVIFAEVTGLDPRSTEGDPPRGIDPAAADLIEAQAAAIVDVPCSSG